MTLTATGRKTLIAEQRNFFMDGGMLVLLMDGPVVLGSLTVKALFPGPHDFPIVYDGRARELCDERGSTLFELPNPPYVAVGDTVSVTLDIG